MTIVACHNTSPTRQRVYYTNRLGIPCEPTRTFITRIENPAGLSGLAQFLAANVPNTSNHRGALMVRCYNDQVTEADLVRASGRANAEALIHAYDLDAKPATINDWQFLVIGDDETAEAFWRRTADEMVRVGVTRVAVDKPGAGRVEFRVGD